MDQGLELSKGTVVVSKRLVNASTLPDAREKLRKAAYAFGLGGKLPTRVAGPRDHPE
jgi:hypothetical protein